MEEIEKKLNGMEKSLNALHLRNDTKDKEQAIFEADVKRGISELKEVNTKRDLAEAKQSGRDEVLKDLEEKKDIKKRAKESRIQWGLVFVISFCVWIVNSIVTGKPALGS